jgi:hypothetical protein
MSVTFALLVVLGGVILIVLLLAQRRPGSPGAANNVAVRKTREKTSVVENVRERASVAHRAREDAPVDQGARGPLVRYALRSLMTRSEREFFENFRKVLPVGTDIYAQVAMGALIEVVEGSYSERNRFDRKVIDFLVCSAGGAALYAVELDDPSHGRKSAKKRDAVKNDVCALAGLPLVRYQSVYVERSVLLADFGRFGGVDVAAAEVDRVKDANCNTV